MNPYETAEKGIKFSTEAYLIDKLIKSLTKPFGAIGTDAIACTSGKNSLMFKGFH
jgi:hypothetical protein